MEKAKNKAAIRKIAIGGTSALVLGTATSFAAYNVVTNDTPETPAGTNLDAPAGAPAEPTFNEAFKAARENFGPGGAFEWKGNIYSTFTAEEWDSMSDLEQEQYALNVESLFNNPDDLDADLFTDYDMDLMAEVALDTQMDGDPVGNEIDDAILEAEGEIIAEAALDNAIDDIVMEAEIEAAVEAELEAEIDAAIEDENIEIAKEIILEADEIAIEPIAVEQDQTMEMPADVPMMETPDVATGEMPDYINNAGDEIGLI